MKDVTNVVLPLVHGREQPQLKQSKQFQLFNQVNTQLTQAVKEVRYIAAQADDIQQQKLQQFSELIARASKCVQGQPSGSALQQLAWKQQRNMIMVNIEIIQQQLQKLTAIRVADAPLFLKEQDDSIEITAQSMQLQEKPSADMYQVNSILRDIQSIQKVTNTVIQMQGQSLWRIEAGIDQATENVNEANSRFTRALRNVKGYWKCVVIAFAVVLLYLVIRTLIRKL